MRTLFRRSAILFAFVFFVGTTMHANVHSVHEDRSPQHCVVCKTSVDGDGIEPISLAPTSASISLILESQKILTAASFTLLGSPRAPPPTPISS